MKYELCEICAIRERGIWQPDGSQIKCSERPDKCPGFRPVKVVE